MLFKIYFFYFAVTISDYVIDKLIFIAHNYYYYYYYYYLLEPNMVANYICPKL